MEQVAPDLYLLDGFPQYGINIYLMGDVLVDAGRQSDKRRILRQLNGRSVSAHAITHAHADHQGASHAVCDTLQIPLWCGEKDVAAMQSGDLSGQFPPPLGLIARLQLRFWAGPAHPVARPLHEGDKVAEFTVIETPGHAPGHISFWREADRLLLLGDVLFNGDFLGRVGLQEPPDIFTVDPALNRKSARKVAQLNPEVICFGHGPVLRNGRLFQQFITQLVK